jgi:O-antigen/teichoic acid export membrane protein
MSPSDYGMVANYLVLLAVLSAFIGLNANSAVAINFFKLDRDNFRKYTANALGILLISTFVLSLLLCVFSGVLLKYLKIPRIWSCIAPFLVSCQFITSINLILWQSEQRPKPYSAYQVLQTMVNVTLILLFVVGLKMTWRGQLLALLVSTVTFALVSFVVIVRRGYLKFEFHDGHIKDALFFGVPLIPHQLSGWLRTGVDRIFLTNIIGIASTGLYSVGYQFGMIIGVLGSAFNRAWSPFLFNKLKSADLGQKTRLVEFIYLCFIAVTVFTLLFSVVAPWVMSFFLGDRFRDSSKFVVWIAFGYAFDVMYYMVANQIFYAKASHLIALATFTSSVVHIILSYSLIRLNGAIGCAQATTISFFIFFILTWTLSARVYPMPWLIFNGRKTVEPQEGSRSE